jgi:micrococcal nuclease
MFRMNKGSSMQPTYRYRAVLVRVVDADTFEVDIDLGLYVWVRRQHLRLKDVWAPELRTVIGDALHARLLLLFPAGTPLLVETQKSKAQADVRSFTRWVADVWVGDDVHVNPWVQAMVEGRA